MNYRLPVAGAILIVGSVVGIVERPHLGGRGAIIVLSVGQGDCTVVESEGRADLIDVGPNRLGVDAGATIIVPRLRELGITRVDWILLSHPDQDHIGGLKSVLKAFPNAVVSAPICFKNFPKMDTRLRKMGVSLRAVDWTAGANGELGHFKIQVRCPSWNPAEDDNMGSMFVHITDGKASFTTSGDAPKATEIQMLPSLNWRAQILHLGHHGSKFSTSRAWLRAVDPEIAIASCGLNNPYGHPHKATVDRVKQFGCRFYRTDHDGDLLFIDTGHGFVKRSMP